MLAGSILYLPSQMKLHFFKLGLAGLFITPFLLLAAQQTSNLQESTPTVKSALIQVISKQLDAFRTGDFGKAYTFASTEIQHQFAPADFEAMVKNSYPSMLRAVDIDFGAALDDGEEGVVFVKLTDASGKLRLFRYTLKLEGAQWRITGVEQAEDTPSRAPLSA
jgi:hypothetical protein